ncbi:carboxypeptidase B-like protein [Dinothrombium tinctorium]|uniref:Carboxypeptidase B-like protein n=1 Tax=Dinothrombium tinctorium TaxID=1965070 RepID=A0A443QK46_9ACAR|nr:carboxypeptidase B-like protein [Dinothrombium tinctorium]
MSSARQMVCGFRFILQNKIAAFAAQNGRNSLKNLVDFWSSPTHTLTPIIFSVNPSSRRHVLRFLKQQNLNATVLTNNLQEWIDREARDESINFETYHPYEMIETILKSQTAKFSAKVIYSTIGKTYENRNIYAMVIDENPNESKPVVMLECGIHAREWVSPATCLWISNQLLKNSSESELLQKFSFHIIPVANPDGYVYSWRTNRMWRKNRVPNDFFGFCRGVDLNRNFGTNFCKTGASPISCDNSYCGKKAFSEKESQAIRDHVLSIKKSKLKAFFSVHSFSQFWMYPYGYKDDLAQNHEQYNTLSKLAVDAIRKVHEEQYQYGSISKIIYKASGNTIDWLQENNLSEVSFAIELRDKGYYGFFLPPHLIRPTAEEFWAGVKAVIQNI